VEHGHTEEGKDRLVGSEGEAEEEVELVSEVEDMEEELDPPAGIGLRFDEIEQMIDEVLSIDDS
jgi:hypothetical protein